MLITKIETVSTPATLTSSAEKPRRPTWKAVSACRSPSPTAIFPNAVEVPVETTTPRPAPWWTTVPMNAQPGRSRGESPTGARVGGLLDRQRLAVSTASSHSSPVTSTSRRSAGTTSPTRSPTRSPGTRFVDVGRDLACRRARPRPRGGCSRCRSATACRGAVLVEEAEPDAERDDRGDDRRVGRIARQTRDRGRGEQQEQQRVAELRCEDAERCHATNPQRVRAVLGEAHRGLRGGKALRGAVEPGADGIGGEGAALARSSCGSACHRAIVTGAPLPGHR